MELTALLVVPPTEITRAADFYRQVFGAEIVSDEPEQAGIMIGSNLLIITCPSRTDLSPSMLCLRLWCSDPEQFAKRILNTEEFTPTAEHCESLVRNVKDEHGILWQFTNKNEMHVTEPKPNVDQVDSEIEVMSVTPNAFVPANKAKKATYCYRDAFGGETLRYNVIPEQEDEDPVHCYQITIGSSKLLITDGRDGNSNICLELNLNNSTDIRAARDFAKKNGCTVMRDVEEDPLRPGVLVATLTDPFNFVWKLTNSAGGLGPHEDGFLCFERVNIVVIGGGDAEMFDIGGTPTVIPEDISRQEFFKRFWKGCRENVVVVVGYELSKEIVSYLRDNIGFRGMIVGLVSGSVDIDQEKQMMLMCQYGCDTSLGIPLTQKAISNLLITSLEKKEERAQAAAGSSTHKVESTDRANAKRLLSELRTEKEEALKRKIDEEKKKEALEKEVTKAEQEEEAEAPKEKKKKKKEEEEDKEKVEEEALRQQRKKRRMKKQGQQRRKIGLGPFFRPPFLFAVRRGSTLPGYKQ